jgi:transposase
VAVRPRKGSAAVCSRCDLPAPGYGQLAERRFEFIPVWEFFVFLLYTLGRVDVAAAAVPFTSVFRMLRIFPGGTPYV